VRATLLKEMPTAPPPDLPAPKPAAAQQYLDSWLARQTPEKKERAQFRDAVSAVMDEELGPTGWSRQLPGVYSAAHPCGRFTRCVALATSPPCSEAEEAQRHPALKPGAAMLWLQVTIRPEHEGAGQIDIVLPPALASLARHRRGPADHGVSRRYRIRTELVSPRGQAKAKCSRPHSRASRSADWGARAGRRRREHRFR
jgi:hypothetical protein